MEQVPVKTNNQCEMLDITKDIERVVKKSGVKSGLCYVFVPHTTAGVTINENADPDVVSDILMELNKIVPLKDNYLHAEGNSAAHIKASLVGSSVHLVIDGGRLKLGTWQSVFFAEFDGPRRRRLWVTMVPSHPK